MKITINGIEVEGTPTEVAELIASMPTKNTSSPSVSTPPIAEIRDAVRNQNITFTTQEPLTKELEYVHALYRYRPNKNSPAGKGPYVVQLLTSGQQYTIRQLCRLAQADQSLVSRAIRRAADGGSVIEVSSSTTSKLTLNTKVRLISIGTIEQAKSAHTSSKKDVKTYVRPEPRIFSDKAQELLKEENVRQQDAQQAAIFRLLNKNKEENS
jgi:hypothetical protein